MDISNSPALVSVKEAVQHPSKCSHDTVLLLRRLLSASDTQHDNEQNKSSTPGRRPASRPPSRKTTRITRARTATKVPVYQTSTSCSDASLSKHDKLVLATDVFNTASKSLSDYIKIQAPLNTRKSIEPKRRVEDARKSTPKKPLQPTSPNRAIVRSPVKGKFSGDQKAAPNPRPDVSSVADCARLALSSLRALRPDENNNAGLNLQLEQGLCVLVGKMLAVGLEEMAVKELRKLKRRIRLDDCGGGSKGVEDEGRTGKSNEPLEELMVFESIPSTGRLLPLFISFQTHVLKIIASEQRASTVNELPDALLTSRPSSPSSTIITALRQGVITEDKATQHLQLIAHTILSLANTLSCSADIKSSASKPRIKPTVPLRLQLLALEIRSTVWKISGHRCDRAKELWDPLVRYFTAFARRSLTVRESDYDCIKEAFENFELSVKSNGYRLTTTDSSGSSSLSTMFRTLSQLAHSAGRREDASRYCERAVKSLSSDQYLQSALCRCKAALVSIELLPKESISRATAAIDEAAASLTAPLRGCQSDMEELLVESARLKKAAMGALSTLGNVSSSEKRIVMFRLSTSSYLVIFVRLLNRYLSPSGSSDSTAPTGRLEKFRNIASAAVDSGLSIGKVAIATEQPPWVEIEPLLSDCLRLLIGFQREGDDQYEPDMPGSRSGFVKLSNLYWSLYVSEKEKAKETAVLVRIVERSVSVLQKASSTDQSSGLIAIKWEKLANLYSDCGESSKSESAFIKSIRSHLAAGALDNATQLAHPPKFWRDSKSAGFALGRVLNAFMRTRLKHGRQGADVFYDSKELNLEQRAVLLERQMMIMIDPSFPNLDDVSCIPPIVRTLLSLYSLELYPIHRMRAVLQIIRFLLDGRSRVEESFHEAIVDEAKNCLTYEAALPTDCGLPQLRDYVASSLRLALGFFIGHLPVYILNQVIGSWVRLLQNYSRWQELEAVVDEVSTWKSQIRSLVDYLESYGLWKQNIHALSVLRQILEVQPEQDYAMMVTCLSKLGLQYCRLGYAGLAQASLARAEAVVIQQDVPPLETLAWHLAYAEHLLTTEKVDKCIGVLSDARSIFDQYSSDLSACGFRTRCTLERFVADATSLLSRISMYNGDLAQATYHAKSAMKLSSRIWARLDKYAKTKGDKSGSSTPEQDVETVTNRIAAIDLSSSTDVVLSEYYYKGSLYWPHFVSHCNTLVHLSQIAAHVGLFQDAVYYGEQVLEIGKSIGSKYSVAVVRAELAKYQILGGQLAKGGSLLSQALESSEIFDKCIDTILFDVSMSYQYGQRGKPGDENTILDSACHALAEVSDDNYAGSLDPFNEAPIAEIANKAEELSIRPNSRSTRTVRVRQAKRPVAESSGRTKKIPLQKGQSLAKSPLFSKLEGDLLRRRATALLACQKLSDANALMDEDNGFSTSGLAEVTQSIIRSECLLATAIKKLASHGVYCVLHESPISMPSIQAQSTKTAGVRSTTKRKTKATTTTRGTKGSALSSRRSVPVSSDEFTPLLSGAKKLLSDIAASATVHGSTVDIHTLSFLLGRISMLTYATTSKDGAILDTTNPACAIELGRNTSFLRESSAIVCDKQLSEPPRPLEWPSKPTKQVKSVSTPEPDLIRSCIDVLPENWQVISLTLSADRSEFVISRLRAGHEPFLLCLPLKRSDPDNVDEEGFDFDSGKAELLEVIKLANESAHATEARFDKKLKKQWWENRESLDERLKLLLYNIEAIWFGGFRGVFAPKTQNDELLSQFILSFQKILEKHLPSRNKRGTENQSNAALDLNVMELFIKIGSLEDEANPEDSVMDLLYFVVDILQFHGERNAYDEIDFDMMVVDTLDALRTYREIERREKISDNQSHTILILDKALHGFPFESLDCMQESSVSRMPSLDCLHKRILQSRSSHPNKYCHAGFHVDRARGSYILNPGGDLKSTQTTFEASLSKLDGWTNIVQRDPTEDEFKDALEDRDLLLYFGHGSGAQYIRGRTIKRLDRCAVTFLMGCSSALMTEAGEFEPYGTPWNYMHAGSPALVATLWDVTDKDIDRFANSVFEQWGLVDASQSNAESQAARKTKGRRADKPNSMASVPASACLDTAVSRSRGACVLKYLNGAAPVVYGIPVFLK